VTSGNQVAQPLCCERVNFVIIGRHGSGFALNLITDDFGGAAVRVGFGKPVVSFFAVNPDAGDLLGHVRVNVVCLFVMADGQLFQLFMFFGHFVFLLRLAFPAT